MAALSPGSTAPPIAGVAAGDGVRALFFYKVTCPVCQLAAPVTERFEQGYPGRIDGVGQDPPDRLAEFSREYGVSFPSVSDLPPYEASDAYGIRVVPTLFLVDEGGTILDTVESWDGEGFNRVSRRLAALTGREYVPISEPGDGLPAFRPG
jgi:thiol-disulfide isomerase/thioredoxin